MVKKKHRTDESKKKKIWRRIRTFRLQKKKKKKLQKKSKFGINCVKQIVEKHLTKSFNIIFLAAVTAVTAAVVLCFRRQEKKKKKTTSSLVTSKTVKTNQTKTNILEATTNL